MTDSWFEWNEQHAVNVLETLYRNPDKPIHEIKDDVEVGGDKFRKIVRGLKEHGYFKSRRGRYVDHRVTREGKIWLLKKKPRAFLATINA